MPWHPTVLARDIRAGRDQKALIAMIAAAALRMPAGRGPGNRPVAAG